MDTAQRLSESAHQTGQLQSSHIIREEPISDLPSRRENGCQLQAKAGESSKARSAVRMVFFSSSILCISLCVPLGFSEIPSFLQPVNSSIRCARVIDGSDVNFDGTEVNEIGEEFSCESRGSSLFALYAEPAPPEPEPKTAETPVLRNACAIIGIFITFTCALSISCTNSSWGLIKCVKLNVCVALLALFTTSLVETSSMFDEVRTNRLVDRKCRSPHDLL